MLQIMSRRRTQGHPGPVVTHRGPWISVAGGLLHVTQRHPSIKGCRDECMAQRMRTNWLGNLRTAGDPPNDPAGPVTVKTPTVRRDEDRTAVTFSYGQIDCPRCTRCQQDGDGLPSLAKDGECPMTPLEAQGLDVASPDLEETQVALIAEGDELTKIQRIGVASEPSVAAEEPGECYVFRTGKLRIVDADGCRWNGGHGIPPESMGLGGRGDRAPDG